MCISLEWFMGASMRWIWPVSPSVRGFTCFVLRLTPFTTTLPVFLLTSSTVDTVPLSLPLITWRATAPFAPIATTQPHAHRASAHHSPPAHGRICPSSHIRDKRVARRQADCVAERLFRSRPHTLELHRL